MKHTLPPGNTLLVDGPASVYIESGQIEVLAAPLKAGTKAVVRDGKRVPFEAKKRTILQVKLGADEAPEIFEGSTIPPSWVEAANEALQCEKPVTILVVGMTDSGKTSFCTYLANKALKKMLKTAVIDADIGQADIGPPATIGYARLEKPINDLFELEVEDAYFVGQTSPVGAENRVINGVTCLKSKMAGNIDLLIVNTDGWVEGEDALKFKLKMIESISANVVVGTQQKKEIAPLLDTLKDCLALEATTPDAIKKRNLDDRKRLRELSYKKYLKGGKIRTFFLSWVNLEGLTLTGGQELRGDELYDVERMLKMNPLYCEGNLDTLLIALKRKQQLSEDELEELEATFRRKIRILYEGDEKGFLLSMHDKAGIFLGIGVLEGINFRKKRRTFRVYTPVEGNVSAIHVGKIKLDRKCKEVTFPESSSGAYEP